MALRFRLANSRDAVQLADLRWRLKNDDYSAFSITAKNDLVTACTRAAPCPRRLPSELWLGFATSWRDPCCSAELNRIARQPEVSRRCNAAGSPGTKPALIHAGARMRSRLILGELPMCAV